MTERKDVLPVSLAPRGLSRVQAAAYVGVSPMSFDAMVDAGTMPKPRLALPTKRRVFDRFELDAAMAALPHKDEEANGVADTWADYGENQIAVR